MTQEKKTPVKMSDVQAKADEKKCPVQRSLVYVEEFLAEPMCGRCFPCSMGTFETRIRLNSIISGNGSDTDIQVIKQISTHMLTGSMCKKGKDTAQYILDQIGTGDFSEHIEGACSANECRTFISYIIIPEKCTICGACQDVCKDSAVIGEKLKPYLSGYLPFEIAQKRCTKCGECVKVCKDNAIEVLTAKVMAERTAVGV
jgi:ferredoxin